jgi:hypothetical protein
VPSKRQTTITSFFRANADEVPKSWELEQRVARLELQMNDVKSALNLQAKRTIALQAHIDHLIARLSVR